MKKLSINQLSEYAIHSADKKETASELEKLFFTGPPIRTLKELQESRSKMISILLPIAECKGEKSIRAFEKEILGLTKTRVATLTELHERDSIEDGFSDAIIKEWQKVSDRYIRERKCCMTVTDEEEYLYCFCDETESNEG